MQTNSNFVSAIELDQCRQSIAELGYKIEDFDFNPIPFLTPPAIVTLSGNLLIKRTSSVKEVNYLIGIDLDSLPSRFHNHLQNGVFGVP